MNGKKLYSVLFVITFLLGVFMVGVSQPEVSAGDPPLCPGLYCSSIVQCLDISPNCPATNGWALHRVGHNGIECDNYCQYKIGCGC